MPPPGAYPAPNGGGPRPSMPPTPIPSHAHPYYAQSPQSTPHLSCPAYIPSYPNFAPSAPRRPVPDDDAASRRARRRPAASIRGRPSAPGADGRARVRNAVAGEFSCAFCRCLGIEGNAALGGPVLSVLSSVVFICHCGISLCCCCRLHLHSIDVVCCCMQMLPREMHGRLRGRICVQANKIKEQQREHGEM